MVDPTAEELELSIGNRDFTIRQSPGVLQSNREGGTTGAVVWRACVRFAEWIGSPHNVLFKQGILGPESIVLELGTGISALIPLMISSRVKKVIATDQRYALKLLQENMDANQSVIKSIASNRKAHAIQSNPNSIDVVALDWETDDTVSFLRSHRIEVGVDAILACDCIFNYALITPLVQTCVEMCRARTSPGSVDDGVHPRPTRCIITQQLRHPEVFEQWLGAFMESFHAWRVPSDLLSDGMKEGSAFVMHVGILR